METFNFQQVKEQRDIETNELRGYLIDNTLFVPLETANSHYQQVQQWIEQGNTPDPAFTIDDLKRKKIQEIKSEYEQANQEDITYMNTAFQADSYTQDLIAKVLVAGSVPGGFFWLDKDNNQVSMSYQDLQGLSQAILIRNQQNFVKYQNLKNQVKQATTQEELDGLNI